MLRGIMGGLGSHHVHPYALQAGAFFISLILPGLVFALLGGSFIEHRRRNYSEK
jgi:hypothetical protein